MPDTPDTIGTKIISVDIEREMKKSFLDYSMSVITSRALPDVRDGLKPVHRRILYTLYENGLTAEKPYRKCADTVGSVLGRYHPHGDMSVYDAMVRMAQDFSLRYPLVDGHGNFGSVDGDPPAAYRYTESRMSKISAYMLADLEKETVNFVPNYDDRLQEPEVLPSRFPNMLVNGSTGIAVGMATNIPPHNIREVIDGASALIDNPELGLSGLMEHIQGPDFPTGGIIMGRAGIRAAYATGRGRVLVRARTEIEEMKNDRFRIVVTEIPYMVNKARLIENIAELVKDKRVEGISDLRDESDREGMRIVIELKRDANAQVISNQLFSYTQLQETFGVIMLALKGGEPKVLTLKEMLESYIEYQKEIITRRTAFDLRKAKERAHILEGLKIALDFIDEVIAILRASKSIPEGKDALMERFGLTDIQASAIVAMRLGQLTGLEREKIEEELLAIKEKIAELEAILADEHKVLAIVRAEINEIKEKFKDERRTAIENVGGEVDIEDLIPEEASVLTLTHYGYIKRQAMDVYRSQKRGGRGIMGLSRREEDFVKELFVCSTHDYVLFFTSRGRVYRMKGYEIPEGSRASRGMNIVNLLPLEQGEKVSSMIRVGELDESGFFCMVTKHGVIKRTEISNFKNVRKSGLIAINLDEEDELAFVAKTAGEDKLIVATKNGIAICFAETNARELGRTARGVRAIRLDDGDEVVGVAIATPGMKLLTITDKGQGRRTDVSEYHLQSRGGRGSINFKCNEEKGHVVGVKTVGELDDVIMITDDGVIIRFAANTVAEQSRYAGGVRAIRLSEGSRVVTFVTAEQETEAETDLPDDPEDMDEETELGQDEFDN